MRNETTSRAASLAGSMMIGAASFLGMAIVIWTYRNWLANDAGTASLPHWLPVSSYAASNVAIVYWVSRRGANQA